MGDLFKGYILTKDKKSIEKIKNRSDFKTYDEVKNAPSFGGMLADDVILIDIDDKTQSDILLQIVDDLELHCRVYETTRGKHFLFRNRGVASNGTHKKLACGLEADIKLGNKNSYEVLKIDGKEREIIYDILDGEEYGELPKWLLPIKSDVSFLGMEEGDGRNQQLFNYILQLQSHDFTVEEVKKTIHIINKYILAKPLSEGEINVILRDEAFSKPSFFKGTTFLFDKFARYLVAQHRIIKINGQLHYYDDGIYLSGNEHIESLMIKYIPNLNRAKRKEVLEYLMILITENTMPSSADYIAFKNGVYNISTEEFIDFTPDIIITNKINYNYNPDAYDQTMDETLDKLACHDEKIRALLEEVIGYTFYRRNELRKAFVLIGEKSNGKSTFIDIIKMLLGEENTSALDLKELGDRFKTAELFGKLANLGDDIGDEFIPNTSIFKKVVSGDRINVEKKNQDPFDFNNYSKFIFSANNIPRMGRGKDTAAIVDRLIIVPFNATFSPQDDDFDPYIKYKLRTDQAMEYLIQIGLDGLFNVLQARHFTTSEKIDKQLREYEENNNPALLFFKEIQGREIENEPTASVYMRYTEFCLTNGFQAISNIEFSKQVRAYYGLEVKVKNINKKSVRVFVKA